VKENFLPSAQPAAVHLKSVYAIGAISYCLIVKTNIHPFSVSKIVGKPSGFYTIENCLSQFIGISLTLMSSVDTNASIIHSGHPTMNK